VPESPEPSPSPPRYDFSVVRQLRQQEGQTLAQLSEACGISISVISKLERNQSTAELETIAKIAGAFGLAGSDLVSLAESPLAHRKTADGYQAEGFYFHRIRYANHHSFLGEAKKGATLSRPDAHGDDLETCWVINGGLRLTIGEQTLTLKAGESVQFDAIQEHTYEALDDTIFILLHLKKSNRF
jgi:transcriptional regulator with XRE-family HTH domain